MVRKLFELMILSFIVALGLVVEVEAASGRWSFFGDARPVLEGTKPNSCAVELSSVCLEGIDCTSTGEPTFSGITFRSRNKKLTLARIYHLSASFKIRSGPNGRGDCAGGSPRFSIGIDTNGDGNADGHVFAYIGPTPDFSGCAADVWQETGNLIAGSEPRFEVGDLLGGTESEPISDPVYMTYQEVLDKLGDIVHKPVLYVMFVLDGGWLENQSVLAEKLQINHFKFTDRDCRKR